MLLLDNIISNINSSIKNSTLKSKSGIILQPKFKYSLEEYKKNENFSMKLCKFFTNGLVCLNKLRDDYCTYNHDEFCKNIIEESKARKMNDDAMRVYMETQTNWEEAEMTAKFKAIRFFKGKLSSKAMKEYLESLERLMRKNRKLDETSARQRERERRNLKKKEKEQKNNITKK